MILSFSTFEHNLPVVETLLREQERSKIFGGRLGFGLKQRTNFFGLSSSFTASKIALFDRDRMFSVSFGISDTALRNGGAIVEWFSNSNLASKLLLNKVFRRRSSVFLLGRSRRSVCVRNTLSSPFSNFFVAQADGSGLRRDWVGNPTNLFLDVQDFKKDLDRNLFLLDSFDNSCVECSFVEDT